MGTHCIVHFCEPKSAPLASLWLFADGYPEGKTGMLATFKAFFTEVKKQVPDDTRFNDPRYLAARFVVWYASRHASKGVPLDFLGIGVVNSTDTAHAHCRYFVRCHDRKRVPKVTWKKGP